MARLDALAAVIDRRSGSEQSVDAVLVVDMQTGFVTGAAAVPAYEALVASIGRLIENARAAGAAVIFLQNDGAIGTVDAPFTPGWALSFPVRPDEIVVRKVTDDGFVDTDLDAILIRERVHKLAICGVLSEMCVAATARGAIGRGYTVVLPHDGHATYDVPAGPGSQPVPAALAARAAEWSLGDEIVICASVDDVRFAASRDSG